MNEAAPVREQIREMQTMIERQPHFQPFAFSRWGFADLNKGVGSTIAYHDYPIGVDHHKSCGHLVVQDSSGETPRTGRVRNDRQSLGGFLEPYRENSHAVIEATRAWMVMYDAIARKPLTIALQIPLDQRAFEPRDTATRKARRRYPGSPDDFRASPATPPPPPTGEWETGSRPPLPDLSHEGSRVGEVFKIEGRTCAGPGSTLPIGANVGQDTTITQRNAANGGVLSLMFLHWSKSCIVCH